MGIRYYAYAFEGDQTAQAIADPYSILSDDPLADAWGLEPHAAVSVATFEQVTPERDMLYLDKAWRELQAITAPQADTGSGTATARPAFAMFAGDVTHHSMGWDPWVRVLSPEEVVPVAGDLLRISDADAEAVIRARSYFGRDPDQEVAYVLQFLARARGFMAELAAAGRGMVYMIG